MPLWYAHYDNSPSFSDYSSFGGWSEPYAKQVNFRLNSANSSSSFIFSCFSDCIFLIFVVCRGHYAVLWIRCRQELCAQVGLSNMFSYLLCD